MQMDTKQRALALLRELSYVDRDTLEIRKDFQYRGCPFCEVDDGEFIDNYQTRQAVFYKFKKCNRCSLIYPYPRPNKETLESYFKGGEFSDTSEKKIKDTDGKTEMDEKEKKKVMPFVKFAKKAWHNSIFCYTHQEFKKFAKKGYKILDIGAGAGDVAKELIAKGCTVEAVELNPTRARYLREHVGMKVYEGRFEDAALKGSFYDMIMLSQVLMHLFSVKETLEKIRHALKPGGLLVSSQMNFNAISQQTMRSAYPGRGLSPLIVCSWFTAESLHKILGKSGFEIVDTIFRPTGLLEYLFVEGYPGGGLTRFILKTMDKIIKMILKGTKTSDYFSVIARKIG